MANIQMIYREGYCDSSWCGQEKYCAQCHTYAAEDLGCQMFDEGKHEPNVVPFGDCTYAKFRRIYKGVTTKNYTIEPFEDTYNLHLNCMLVTVGKKVYECEKVSIDGECIYNTLEDNPIDTTLQEIKNQIGEMQTYKLFLGDNEKYISRDAVLRLIDEKIKECSE